MTVKLTAYKQDESGDYADLLVGETLDFGNDFTNELLADSDTVATSAWAVDSGLTTSTPQINANITSVFLTCTQAGVMQVTNTVTTTNGRTYKERFRIIGAA